jgi:DNA-binding response OmpR family regulator
MTHSEQGTRPGRVVAIARDAALVQRMREWLEAREFALDVTDDGRTVLELVGGSPTRLVVVELELSGGQNGYILCGRLKQNEALHHIPVVLVGSPEGFPMHQKLKTRADGYVAKPVDFSALTHQLEFLLEGGSGALPPLQGARLEGDGRPEVTGPQRQQPGAWGWLGRLFRS